jgi:hypothetical protein
VWPTSDFVALMGIRAARHFEEVLDRLDLYRVADGRTSHVDVVDLPADAGVACSPW